MINDDFKKAFEESKKQFQQTSNTETESTSFDSELKQLKKMMEANPEFAKSVKNMVGDITKNPELIDKFAKELGGIATKLVGQYIRCITHSVEQSYTR